MNEISARGYLGKRVLIGMTYLDHDETLIAQEQFHGVIVRIDDYGIVVKLHKSNEEFNLPPDLSALKKASKGEYRLYSTNEVVLDPDFLVRWTVIKPAPEDVVH